MENYLLHTEESFDKVADTFDEDDISNPILQWMRNSVYKVYDANFRKGDKLLELNAGTGIDAVHLASKGIKVVATDISANMLTKLRHKLELLKLEDLLKVSKLPFDEIDKLDESKFDGVISNFGGLNCINDFSKLSEDLFWKMNPGGKFIAAVMNRFCPWEMAYFLLKLDPKNAFRRFSRNGIDANLSEFKIKSFYFRPTQFAEFFARHFKFEKVYSLGLFTPCPYMHGLYKRMPAMIKSLMRVDDVSSDKFPFNRIGDHFIIVLSRR